MKNVSRVPMVMSGSYVQAVMGMLLFVFKVIISTDLTFFVE